MSLSNSGSSSQPSPSSIPPPQTLGPPSTGDLVTDVIQTVKNITQIPCARNSLLSGIASGAGIGVMRGLSAGPLMAGHWAIATFTIISLGSWHVCQRRLANERKNVAKIIESMPQRTLKQQDDQGASPSTTP